MHLRCGGISYYCFARNLLLSVYTANVPQTKVDAQCEKPVTKLSSQSLRQSTFSSYNELFVKVTNFNLPHLHLAPLLGVR